LKKVKTPVTAAIRALRAAKAEFEEHLYDYVEKGGTRASSAALGVDEHAVLKTLVFEDETGTPLVVLMHGDFEVSTGALAKHLGCKRITPCEPKVAERHSGYQVGGTSPFGLSRPMRLYAESTIQQLPRLWLNGGKRGFLVSMTPAELARTLPLAWVQVARPD